MGEGFRYRELPEDQVDELYRLWAESIISVICHRLHIPRPVLGFIEPDSTGDIVFQRSTIGFYAAPGNRIFITVGLDIRGLVLLLGHELRHLWQQLTNKHTGSSESRERDACIFERELDVPWREFDIFEWIESSERDMIQDLLGRIDPKTAKDYSMIERPRNVVPAVRSEDL